jgi:sugar lactone lactonase YvrE
MTPCSLCLAYWLTFPGKTMSFYPRSALSSLSLSPAAFRYVRAVRGRLAALAVAALALGCGGSGATDDAVAGAGGEAGQGASGQPGQGGNAGTAGQSVAGQGGHSAGSAGSQAGQGGSGPSGKAGAAGQGNAGTAGSAQAGGGAAGAAGQGPAGQGQAGSGTAGSGQAGSGQAGSGQAGSGQAGQGAGGAAGGGQAGSGQSGNGQAGQGQAGAQNAVFLDKYSLNAQYPEGGVYDPVGGAFYVGSLGDGSVHRIDAATGAESVLFTESAPGKWWTLGMDVDLVRRRLWVCAMDDRSPSPRAGSIWVFDLVTGQRIANHALADAAQDATCTDVALTKNGQGYVGDREQGILYKVDLVDGPSVFASSPDLAASIVGQNALVVLPDESAILSLLYLPSGIARVDLADHSVQQVTIDGTFYDLTPLAGADGMAYANGSVYVAFTSKLVKVTPTFADWSQASSKAIDVPDGMTDVVSTPGGL